jgi:anthranilate synthase component 1
MQIPSREEFLQKTGGIKPMPVYRDILADMETPLSAYWKLSRDETYSFLLESVTGGEQLARYSILGARPRTVIRSKGRQAKRISRNGEQRLEMAEGQDPLHLLKAELGGAQPIAIEGMPKFIGGAIGMLAYDIVRYFEKQEASPNDDLGIDEMAMMLTESVVVFDHAKNIIRIIVIADGSPESYEHATAEIERVAAMLKRPIPELPSTRGGEAEVCRSMSSEEYQAAVGKAIEYIGAGDAIQIVMSQRFSTRADAHPVTIYRALRSLNPSPYMFLLRFSDFDVVGASPEILVSAMNGEARVRPIAGTRWRGKTEEEDDRLAAELLADEKERAEHIMLVDLGRNDLGRVCKYGSVQVNDLMVIEKYSHVMHIVSDVTGEIEAGKDAFDLLRATFPAGTVSGAPKVRAMEIIDELEPTRRGVYAGSIGYISASGEMDMAIAIRTILIKDGQAFVQAGAGIVFDSDPAKEDQECQNKAKAALTAIDIANRGQLPTL